MISKEKEVVTITKMVKLVSKVEEYMRNVEIEMKATVNRKLNEGNKSYDSEPRHLWVSNGQQPGQVVATVAQIRWTDETETAITEQQRDIQSLEHHFN